MNGAGVDSMHFLQTKKAETFNYLPNIAYGICSFINSQSTQEVLINAGKLAIELNCSTTRITYHLKKLIELKVLKLECLQKASGRVHWPSPVVSLLAPFNSLVPMPPDPKQGRKKEKPLVTAQSATETVAMPEPASYDREDELVNALAKVFKEREELKQKVLELKTGIARLEKINEDLMANSAPLIQENQKLVEQVRNLEEKSKKRESVLTALLPIHQKATVDMQYGTVEKIKRS